jgi:G:T-mismatch repair DNA endonuclease (very short patch repair protein)
MSGEFSISSEVEKKFVKECVKPLGIEYVTQHYIKELCHYCDVYIPSKNLIVEFQGDYWHGNPKKYTKEELSDYQLEKVEKDEKLRAYCAEHNIGLIEVWESDYNRDPDSVRKLLVENII